MKNWWKSLNIFFSFSVKDKILFLKTIFSLFSIAFLLKILSFSNFKKTYKVLFGNNKKIASETELANIVYYVKGISKIKIFNINCLPQALTTKYLSGQTADIKLIIGINNDNHDFKAHAWVEKNKTFIIGDIPYQTYTPIWEWA